MLPVFYGKVFEVKKAEGDERIRQNEKEKRQKDDMKRGEIKESSWKTDHVQYLLDFIMNFNETSKTNAKK